MIVLKVLFMRRLSYVVVLRDFETSQWRIQDFPDGGGANPWVWVENLLFDKIFT